MVYAPATSPRALTRLLFKVAVVDDLRAPRGTGRRPCPTWSAVTRDGDVLGTPFAAVARGASPALIEIRAAVDEGETPQLAEATA